MNYVKYQTGKHLHKLGKDNAPEEYLLKFIDVAPSFFSYLNKYKTFPIHHAAGVNSNVQLITFLPQQAIKYIIFKDNKRGEFLINDPGGENSLEVLITWGSDDNPHILLTIDKLRQANIPRKEYIKSKGCRLEVLACSMVR